MNNDTLLLATQITYLTAAVSLVGFVLLLFFFKKDNSNHKSSKK